VLETTLSTHDGAVRVLDFFSMCEDGAEHPRRELVRIVEGLRGSVDVAIEVAPRFDYGVLRPWLRRAGADSFTAIGADNGLAIWSDATAQIEDDSIVARARLRPTDRLRLMIGFIAPHRLAEGVASPSAADADQRLEETLAWWQRWGTRIVPDGPDRAAVMRSGLTLKALSYAPTGAVVAAPTTSLPETLGGERNWDYRYSWIRDSTLSARALANLGCEREARRFAQFIVRSSAGHAEDLRVVCGIGGERERPERGTRPPRLPRLETGTRRQLGHRSASARRTRRDARPRLALASPRPFARR